MNGKKKGKEKTAALSSSHSPLPLPEWSKYFGRFAARLSEAHGRESQNLFVSGQIAFQTNQ